MTKNMSTVLWGAIALVVALATTDHAIAQPSIDGTRFVTLNLTSSASSYRVGEDIAISVRIQNNAGRMIRVQPFTPWDAVDLRIQNLSTMAIVSATHGPNAFKWRFSPAIKINPGASYTFSWASFNDAKTLLTSYPISSWGYGALKPGKYRLTAIAKHVAWTQDGARYYSVGTSNALDIVVSN